MPAVVPSPNQIPFFEELVAPPRAPARPHLRIQPPLLADLTPRQRKAVTHGEGPLLIVAGAGTGKTTVITRRIAWLIAEKLAKPSEILALTFTDRAALEMTERVDRLVPYGFTDTVISTFHAWGDRLLRDHALEAGLSDRSTVLSRAEQVIFLREHLFDLPLDRYRPLGDPTRFLHALVTLISRARDEDVPPSEYRALADQLVARSAADPDDAALAEWAGMTVSVFAGEPGNIKLTTPEDFARAEATQSAMLGDVRTGSGLDVHAFGPGDHVMLGGVRIAHTRALTGHSDADVALHALTDAILGALADGDIGAHFPPSDPQWRGASSDRFLAFAVERVRARKGRIAHLDLTIVCEAPRIGTHRDAMRANIARLAGIGAERVGVKATTSEKLGFTGRGEGIAAYATATIRLPWE